MEEDNLKGRVLSIQSHVVHGHVGNTSAVFPLQLLGYEVDVINSVQFSNHTGYESFKGQVLNSSELEELIFGLRENKLLCYTHLLTGYVGSLSFLSQVYELVIEMKQNNPDLVYVCDPVMGDMGKMYVPQELLPVYRDKFVSIADVLTPNQYEAELLTGITITNEDDACKALDSLLAKGAKAVVITSVEFGQSDQLVLFAKNVKGETVKLSFPKFEAAFTGTGDLFAALLLGWSHEGLKPACEKSIGTMHTVLRRTLNSALALSGGTKPTAAQIELRLVSSKRDIERPSLLYDSSRT